MNCLLPVRQSVFTLTCFLADSHVQLEAKVDNYQYCNIQFKYFARIVRTSEMQSLVLLRDTCAAHMYSAVYVCPQCLSVRLSITI